MSKDALSRLFLFKNWKLAVSNEFWAKINLSQRRKATQRIMKISATLCVSARKIIPNWLDASTIHCLFYRCCLHVSTVVCWPPKAKRQQKTFFPLHYLFTFANEQQPCVLWVASIWKWANAHSSQLTAKKISFNVAGMKLFLNIAT